MASPQLEDGLTPIANDIVEALMKINLSAYESRVLWFLFRKTYGWKKKTDWIALSQFSKSIGLDRRLIHRTIKSLSSKKMIVIEKDDKGNVKYGFQKDYDKWEPSSKKMTVIYTDDAASSKEMTKLSSKEIPTKETITKTKKNNALDPDFLAFYNAYPLKRDRKQALIAWNKLNGTKPHISVLLTAIEKQKLWRDRASPDEFRPEWKYPATWLNGECWLDEVEVKKGKWD